MSMGWHIDNNEYIIILSANTHRHSNITSYHTLNLQLSTARGTACSNGKIKILIR